MASSSSYINIPFLSSFNILLQCLRGVTLLKKFYSVWMKKTAIHTFFAVILILTKMSQTLTLSPCIQWTIHHLQLNSWIIHLPIHSLQFQRNFHNLDNVPSTAFRQSQSSSDEFSTTATSHSSTHSSSPVFSLNPSFSKRKRKTSTSRSVKRKLADSSSSHDFTSTSSESLFIPSSLDPPSAKRKPKSSSSTTRKRELANSTSHDNINSTSTESLLIPPSFTLPSHYSSSPPDSTNPIATSTPVSEESSGESLDEIIEAYNEYTYNEYTLSLSRNSPSLSPASVTHISETELHDISISSDSDTNDKWNNVTTRRKKFLPPNTSTNNSNITHISESSDAELFPEDLSPLSSSTDDTSNFQKFQYFPVTPVFNTDSSSDSSDLYSQESITRYRPNFTIARIPFEQLVYFLKRYLKSVERNPDKPEWPVHGMDKNQKRHFRRKVQDYKLQNDVLYHLHTYTDFVQGKTVKKCKY